VSSLPTLSTPETNCVTGEDLGDETGLSESGFDKTLLVALLPEPGPSGVVRLESKGAMESGVTSQVSGAKLFIGQASCCAKTPKLLQYGQRCLGGTECLVTHVTGHGW
jgi:hypothetical protein